MGTPGRLKLLTAGLAWGILAGAVPASAAEANPPKDTPTKMVYQVQHSKHGNVGTYTNTIEENAGTTTVKTQGRMKVSVLGIPAYRQEFDRVERWKGPQLVNFNGVTTENGKRTEVTGAAQGNQFKLSTPSGIVIAPADVKMANPWSEAILGADAMVAPQEGKVEKVSVTGGEMVPVAINGHNIMTRHYQVLRLGGPKRYEIWFDDQGIPVRFADVSPSETVTFNLSECEGSPVCGLYNTQLARD
jgi:hypothetical protein